MRDDYQNQWGKPTNKLRRLLMKNQKGLCDSCHIPDYELPETMQIHRKLKHGEYSPDNCILLCRGCHNLAHNRS